MSKTSAAKISANRLYTEKAYKRISVYIKNEDVALIDQARGQQSLNGFINDAIMEKIEREKPEELQRIPFDE